MFHSLRSRWPLWLLGGTLLTLLGLSLVYWLSPERLAG